MKKGIAILVLAACLTAMLTGCGTKAGETGNVQAAEPTAAVESANPAAETERPAEETAAPAEKEIPAVNEVAAGEAEPVAYGIGDPVKDFSVRLEDGTVFTLSTALETHDLVMINVWATWCGPCGMEFPAMMEAYEGYRDKVALICLSPFDENESITEYMKENGYDLPMGADTIGALGFCRDGAIPVTVLIDRFGNYVYYECGAMTDPSGFTSLWDPFLEDSYTGEEIIPGQDESVPEDYAAPMVYEIGDTVEDFSVELEDGTVFTLSEALETHELVMINIWATWCGPCGMEFPAMMEAYEGYRDRVALVCLSPDDDNESITKYMEENNYDLPMGTDTVGAVGFCKDNAIPVTVLIDRNGTYVRYELGAKFAPEEFTSLWDQFLVQP